MRASLVLISALAYQHAKQAGASGEECLATGADTLAQGTTTTAATTVTPAVAAVVQATAVPEVGRGPVVMADLLDLGADARAPVPPVPVEDKREPTMIPVDKEAPAEPAPAPAAPPVEEAAPAPMEKAPAPAPAPAPPSCRKFKDMCGVRTCGRGAGQCCDGTQIKSGSGASSQCMLCKSFCCSTLGEGAHLPGCPSGEDM